MMPDPNTIARRRHMVTILLRCFILALAMYTLIGATWATFERAMTWGGSSAGSLLLSALVQFGPLGLLVVAMLLLEKRLVRWLVPPGTRMDMCRSCGYSLRNLRSPVCPECGTDVRSGG